MIPLRACSSYDTSHVQPWETETYFIFHPVILGVLLLFASAAIWSSGVAVAPGELQLPKGRAPPHWLLDIGGSLRRGLMWQRAERRDQYRAYVVGSYADVRVTPPVVRFLVVANGEEKRRYFPPFECRFLFNSSEGSSDYEYPVRALWSSIGHQGGFEPLLVTCPTRRNDSLPRLVSLIYMGEDSSGWLSPRKVERVSKRTGTFALCVTVGEQTQPDPRTLAEFLAFYEAVGASHYIFYIKSAGTGLNYLAALQQKYAEAASTRDKLRVVLDTAQEDDEAVTSCVYDLATSPFEYALAVTPRDFVVPRHYATLKEFIQRYRLAGAMTILRYAFVGPRPVPGVSESSLISQLKVLRLAHADPPGMTSRALVRVADVVQMGARGGFSLLASSRAHVMDPRHVSVCRYVEDSEISPEEVLAYDDHMLGYGDFIRRSLPWRLHIERLGAS
ncbi:hypothetical protein HPB50_021492 [Hyalomma asiaticum]|uniref:Uncharacterized protein n=1 Tax=Hyalomma asiaticum TaxID=266040 RepID=A0ACB7SHY9_HYAAI|nr:hypothetical protein HPB50_021492 [Hyalomma asiaticum]